MKRKQTPTTHQTCLKHPKCYQTRQVCYPTLRVYTPNSYLIQKSTYFSNSC